MPNGFQIISPRLLIANMGVYTGISSCSGQVLSITVRDVLSCLGVSKALGETEIDNIYVMLLFANSNQKVIRLNVSV